ncbi:hypothetical protein GCM10025863_26260 [Microbacterium suwonense]|uniref:Uncharacterized protein n=1 Tax=Microbacterium suwonense TaxID=683047 RepID=A0ABN6X5M6_9MICO|nr:hypothetical protein GCM10025863_26260 [Microbacterium suwonense]
MNDQAVRSTSPPTIAGPSEAPMAAATAYSPLYAPVTVRLGARFHISTTALTENAAYPTDATMTPAIVVTRVGMANAIRHPMIMMVRPMRIIRRLPARSEKSAIGIAATRNATPPGSASDPATPRLTSRTSMAYGVSCARIAAHVPAVAKMPSSRKRRLRSRSRNSSDTTRRKLHGSAWPVVPSASAR